MAAVCRIRTDVTGAAAGAGAGAVGAAVTVDATDGTGTAKIDALVEGGVAMASGATATKFLKWTETYA